MDGARGAWLVGRVTRTIEADYLVVGAGAMGMAFTDALIDHSDAHVVMVDRRPGPGGHWRAAYPFVRLHQSSTFYGVASTLLGGGRVQTDGPEAGLHERADQGTICAYYDQVLAERMVGPGRVELVTSADHLGGRSFVSHDTGEQYDVPEHCRVVDARYLAPEIPAETTPRFAVGEGARVVPVNDLVVEQSSPSQYVVVGSGKTATDACVWLLGNGVDPDAICWVRPREPWMLNRALIQPDPEVYLAMVADLVQAAGSATSLDALFLRLEELGIMLRIDRTRTPTMAKTPTLGVWELELPALDRGRRTPRAPGVRGARPADVRRRLGRGGRRRARRQLRRRRSEEPTPGADLAARRHHPAGGPGRLPLPRRRPGRLRRGDAPGGDDEKNRLCPPSSFGNSLADWARMNVLGMRNAASFGSAPDVKEWVNGVALNPARVPPEHPGSPALDDALGRLQEHSAPGLARLAELADVTTATTRAAG